MTTSHTITILGAGNMGISLLHGLAQHYPHDKLWITDPDTNKLEQVKKQFNVHTTPHNAEAVKHADVVIFAIKPQIFATVAQELTDIIQDQKPLILSIAAGIRVKNIQHWLGNNIAIVRAMPNTPAMIGCGATALFANPFVTPTQKELAESILRVVSLVVWLEDEKMLDTVTALSGSGPAYFFLIIEALQAAAEELGLSAETARLLTLQTALGAARMALESEENIHSLRLKVTSPGGTTEQAIKVLEENNIRDIFKKALTSAKHRSEELAELFDKTES